MSSETGIFLRSGYFHPEGAVIRSKTHNINHILLIRYINLVIMVLSIKQYVKATLRQHDVTQNKLDFNLKGPKLLARGCTLEHVKLAHFRLAKLHNKLHF